MRRRPARRALSSWGLALAACAAAAACAPEALSPLPIQTPTPAAGRAATAPPGASAPPVDPPPVAPPVDPATTPPTPTPTPSPSPTTACLGPIRHVLDLQSPGGPLPTSLCLAAGAILRVQSLEAGALTAEPADLVSGQYEAGGYDLRLLAPGTVTITIVQGEQTDVISVVIR